MKLARFTAKDGVLRQGVVKGGEVFEVEGELFGRLTETGRRFPLKEIRLEIPLTPTALLCIGKNYKDHAEEFGSQVPKEPLLFLKALSSVCGPSDTVDLHADMTSQVDYESELAIVIGRKASKVSEAEALSHVFGYVCANDVSARDCQFRDGQWARGKSLDTFCPLGPWIETELDPSDLKIEGRLNGQVMQSARTAQLIFGIPRLISHLSQGITLHPGTVILTGTPSGCGFARKPPVFLKPGDVYEVEIEGLGVLASSFR